MLLYFVLLLVGRCTSEYAWNNSGFEYPDPWPVEHCEVPPAEARVCMEDKSFSSQFLTCTPESCNITVAIIFPSDPEYLVNLDKASETLNEAAMAVKKFYQEEKNINFNFNLSPFDDRCLPEYASVQMIKVNEIFAHVVFGSVCDFCLASMGRIGKYLGYYGLPLLTPGGLTTDFTTKKQQCTDEFYMVMNTGIVDYRSFAEFFHLILERYKWKKIGVMYNKTTQTALAGEKACQLIVSSILQDTQKDAQSFDGDLVLSDMTPDKFLKTVIGTEYGIILTCLSSRMFRDFAITAYDLNFIGDGEYTIFNFETYNDAPNPLRPWEYPDDPKGNAKARKAFKSVYTFRSSDQAHLQTNKNVGQVYWDSMYDAMFLYAHGLYHTIQGQPNTGEPYSIKGYEIVQNMMGTTYQGKSRNVTMNCNGQRVSEYVMMHVNDSGNYQIVARYTNLNKTIIEWKDDWVNGVPKETPVCGYDMSLCPKFDTVNVLIISLVLVLVLGILIVGVMLYRHFKLKAAIYSMAWKVNHDEIIMFPVKPRQSFQSTMSLQKMEMDGLSMAGDRQLYTTIGFYKTNRIAIKYLADVKFELSHEQLRELKSMKDLSHDNLVKFCGASLDIPNCILTEYCAKGSLQDILENDQVQLDIDFKMSLIMDVLRGMTYLHASVFRSHGALKSSNCLIDSRFVLKIADFGLHFLRKHFGQEEDNDMLESHSYWERQLWTAPELLKMEAPPPEGTPKGDVYSFAFIMHEIIVRKGVFHLEEFMSAKEKVDAVRKGPDANGGQPLRPSLGEALCDEEVTQIMKKCWAEDTTDRPDFATLKNKFRNINKQNDGNLFDNLLARMEQYANNLETLVEERTSDYLEEKRRCEELLYQLLPKSVAQQLINGESVIAETFEHVTIHFSDIVGFTSLSANSTPLEVVEFLNDLYTCFDSIIEHFNVYKVETIGDSYMVVSGLPVQNGDRHAIEIARMSLALLQAVKTFKIRHREDAILKLRIGIHTGPCVAGVVGLKMPRYCLFGDTVNTASRMETNGLPLRIHISPATKAFLEKSGHFDIERRGEVELKGKGKMVTYWLNGELSTPGAPRLVNEVSVTATRPPATPIPSRVRKQVASNGNGRSLNEIADDDLGLRDEDVPLLSITSPPAEQNSNA